MLINLFKYFTNKRSERSSLVEPVAYKHTGSLWDVLDKVKSALSVMSEACQNISMGAAALSSIKISQHKIITAALKYAVYFQLLIDGLSGVLGILSHAFRPNMNEINGEASRRRFLDKSGCYAYEYYDIPMKAFANEDRFLSYIVANYKILDAILASDNDSEKSYLGEFLEKASQQLLLRDVLFSVYLNDSALSIYWMKSNGLIRVYAPLNNCSADLAKGMVFAMHDAYILSFKDQMLIVKGLIWDDCDYLKTLHQDLTCPELYRKDIKDKLAYVMDAAIINKEKCGILLYGIPGVGKSSAAVAAICDMHGLVIRVDYKPTDALVAFLTKITGIPKIIIFEEIDADSYDDGKTDRIQAILQFLDTNCYDIAVMTANSVNLNPALIRSGRCDIKMLLTSPTPEERESILLRLDAKYNIGARDFISKLIMETDGFTHADLHSACKLAKLNGKSLVSYLPEFKQQQQDMKLFGGDNG